MNRTIFNYLFLTAFALSAVFTSCKKDDDKNGNGNGNEKVQLVKTMTFDNGTFWNFEYDEKNRITTMSGEGLRTLTFTYSGDDLVKLLAEDVIYDFSKSGNTITINGNWNGEISTTTIELNNDGYLIASGSTAYQYLDGNLVAASNDKYKYDDKKSPFYNCKTPKWALVWRFMRGWNICSFAIKNNVTEVCYYSKDCLEYTYEYDENGFPTKMYLDGNEHATFTYQIK